MLTADAYGVLPPISKLTPEQASYHFISGYTAKVAGTERGVTEPVPTFSTCFGGPFMPRHPGVYGKLLAEKIKKHNVRCWLINTGWSGGTPSMGVKRIKIAYTRAMVNAALEGKLDNVEFITDEFFGLSYPTSCPDVPSEVLDPKKAWKDLTKYKETASKLTGAFEENFKQYLDGVDEGVKRVLIKKSITNIIYPLNIDKLSIMC
jgi:phosphoenolpyruvate carboxykinase (ATP)